MAGLVGNQLIEEQVQRQVIRRRKLAILNPELNKATTQSLHSRRLA
jgi:hypothetical protein